MTTRPQLSFALDNSGAVNTIYVSTSTTANKLRLVISTNTDTSLTPGNLVPIGQVTKNPGSLFYLNLTALGMTEQEFNALTLDASGWTYKRYSAATGQMIGFTPTLELPLTTSASLTVDLDNFTLATKPPTPTVQLEVEYFHVDKITRGRLVIPFSLGVFVFGSPDSQKQDLHDVIRVCLDPHDVVNCPVGGPTLYNNLTLALYPGTHWTEVKAAEDTVFTLTFVYASDPDGFGAVMTPQQAQSPFAVIPGDGNDGWGVRDYTDAEFPYWELRPTPNKLIIGSKDSISFNIEKLVTNFQPGPTVALLSYQKVPNYQDGVYSILVVKAPHVEIESFTASPAMVLLQHGQSVPSTLSWQVSGATKLTLDPLGMDVDVTTDTSYQIKITDTQKFTLAAEGQRPGNVDNTTSATCVVGWYKGLFLRQYVGQTPNWDPLKSVWNACPDIVLGTDADAILSEYGNPQSAPYVNVTTTSIFVTCVNTSDQPVSARVWLFWADWNARLQPRDWNSDGIWQTYGGNSNYQSLSVAAARSWSDHTVTPVPSAPAITPTQFYLRDLGLPPGYVISFIVIIENNPSDTPTPPLPDQAFASDDDLANWIRSSGNVGWANFTTQSI